MWTNPPIVYEVTNPSAHMIKRITKIVQSMLQLLSIENPPCRIFLSAQVLSPLFLGLLLGFRSGINRAAAMTNKFLSSFDDSFSGLAELLPLLVQVVQSLRAAREQRGGQPADGPYTQTDQQEGEFGFTVASHAFTLFF
jgi:hypothetical protein